MTVEIFETLAPIEDRGENTRDDGMLCFRPPLLLRFLFNASSCVDPNQIYSRFSSRFLYVLMSGLTTAVPDFIPIPEVLFGEGTNHGHICEEVIRVPT